MSKDHSFDIASKIDLQEVDNAVNQALKEISQRFDFKGSTSTLELDKSKKTITLKTENEFRLKTILDMLRTKCAKRNVSLKALQVGDLESGMIGGSVKQIITLQDGIPTDKAKEITKYIKETKLKVQTQIQEGQVRVQAAKIDDLQTVIAQLRQQDFGVDLQYLNYR